MTEPQIPQLAGALTTHQRKFSSLSTEDAQWVISNTAAAIALFVTAVQNRAKETVVEVVKKLFTKLVVVTVAATVAKRTRDCFTSSIWSYRDSDFDNWLSTKSQSKKGATTVTVVKPEQDGWTFIEFAQAVLGVTTSDVKELGNLLIAGGHTLTLTQAENLAERTEAGEATDLKTDGYGNSFFLETGDENQPVAVGSVSRLVVHRWHARVDRLDDDRRWDVDSRFLLCNADTSKL